MIDVYSWSTGNARKIYICLEEMGLEYRVHPVNIGKGDQFKPEFLKISPNNRIPAIIDRDGPGMRDYSLFETGAILIYLAEKTGKFRPADPGKWFDVIQWLMWQMGGIGPMFGQAGHFVRRKDEPGMAYALKRYTDEAKRLCGVLDRRLAQVEYVAGEDYSIADMAIYPWCQSPERRGLDLADFPNVSRWFAVMAAKPATIRADEIAEEVRQRWAAEHGSAAGVAQ